MIPIEGGVWGLWFSLAWKEKRKKGMIWYWLMNVDGSVARNGNGEWLVGIMFRYGLCWLLLMSIGRWLRGAEWGNGNGLGVKGLKRDSFQRNCYSFFLLLFYFFFFPCHTPLVFSSRSTLLSCPPCGLILSIHSYSYSYYVMIWWRWWRYMIRHYPRHCHCPNLLNQPPTPNSPPLAFSFSLLLFFLTSLYSVFRSEFLFFSLFLFLCVYLCSREIWLCWLRHSYMQNSFFLWIIV